MKTITIYYDANHKCKQVVRPTSKFEGDVYGLVQNITKSDRDRKNYYTFEIHDV